MKGPFFGIAAMLLAMPAAAQDRLWGYSGPWEIRQDTPVCTMRYGAKDPAETGLVIRQRHGFGIQLEASGKGWRHGTCSIGGARVSPRPRSMRTAGRPAAVSTS